ncbi:hypothetical protein [Antrihabitans cavernicola]|uniref:hypothetical protein n=1 Tax=Antrihabitans cavernicola TaxID=2495913 RepID=UPI0011EF05FB|nr:hypothetical protein [Spelaeibacter cavernicola]
MDIRTLCEQVGREKNLRQGTIFSSRRLLLGLGVTDDSLGRKDLESRLFELDNPSTRRAVIAIRSVLGHPIKIPKAPKRVYVLPDESTLRLALMTSPHEVRGLLMMYAGLRIGEACAVTAKAVNGDRPLVDRQIVELYASPRETGRDSDRVRRVGPVKCTEASIVIRAVPNGRDQYYAVDGGVVIFNVSGVKAQIDQLGNLVCHVAYLEYYATLDANEVAH